MLDLFWSLTRLPELDNFFKIQVNVKNTFFYISKRSFGNKKEFTMALLRIFYDHLLYMFKKL